MRIALAQYMPAVDLKSNLARVLDLMHEASRQKVQMIVLPELCLSPLFSVCRTGCVSVCHDAVGKLRARCGRRAGN